MGGQLFKATVRVWTRDRFSILAQLCTTTPRLTKLCPEDDAYFFDRDFWVFRFILAFLRDNALPESVDVLRELYCEASYYRIGLLRHAIEAKMIGEESMAAGIHTARVIRPTTTVDQTVSRLPSPVKPITKKEIATSGDEDRRSSSITKLQEKPNPSVQLEQKYSELPDPFGFTSKKKG